MELENGKTIYKKTIAVLLSIALIGCVTFGNAERARADIIGASIFTALPVSWPVVATVLIACGVGTAVYYATLPPEKKDEIVTQVVNLLSARRLTLLTEAIYKGYQKQYAQGSGQYVKGCVGSDGKSYLSNEVVDTILDVARDLGYTGGRVTNVTGYVGPLTLLAGTKVSDLNRVTPQMLTNMVTWEWFSEQKISYSNLASSLSENDIVWITRSSTYYLVWVYPFQYFGDIVITGNYDQRSKYIYTEGNIRGFQYRLNSDGTYTNLMERDVNYIQSTLGQEIGVNLDDATNLGLYQSTISGAPVGELGQSIEQDGAWTHPGGDYAIDNYGDATPISTDPAVTGADVVVSSWDGSIPFPQSITLPDVIAVPDGINVPATQTEAIEGDADDVEPVVVPSPITADYNAFLVPDWIKRRFPFCIPFDISRAIEGMNDSKRLVIDFTVTISGFPVHVYQDFSDFEGMFETVRSGVFIMYGIFLFFVTKEMIKW